MEQLIQKEKELYKIMSEELAEIGIGPLSMDRFYKTHLMPENFQVLFVDIEKLTRNEDFCMLDNSREEYINKIKKVLIYKKEVENRLQGKKEKHKLILDIENRLMNSRVFSIKNEEITETKERMDCFLKTAEKMGYEKEVREFKIKKIFSEKRTALELNDLKTKMGQELHQITRDLAEDLLAWMERSESISTLLDRVAKRKVRGM